MTPVANDSFDTEKISIIAELVFLDVPPINFARLVGDLDTVLTRLHSTDRELVWDCEDVAIFDMPGTRIALAYSEQPRTGIVASLTVSVGPSHLPPRETSLKAASMQHYVLCSKLVERVQARLSPDAVFWHETAELVTVEMIDELAQIAPVMRERPLANHPIFTAPDVCAVDNTYRHQRPVRAIATLPITAANATPDLPLPRNAELARLRAALYPDDTAPQPAQASAQMRLAAHTMNATLIMVSFPLGVALVGYSLVKGDNMRLTSRMMVLTGCVTALAQSEWAQQMVAFGGV